MKTALDPARMIRLQPLCSCYYPNQFKVWKFSFPDKPWDEDFQDIPGTPGRGDQFSLGATYSW